MPRKVGYDANNLGQVIKEERERQGLSQQELADLVGVSRTMVAKMEKDNHGLNSVQTRRDVARALGISPLVLGIGSTADVKAKPIYNTNILRMTLGLHREAYFTSGNFGITAVNTMVSEIKGILEDEGNRKEILEVYAEYNILGVDVGGEEMNLMETTQYIDTSLDIARSLNNPVLLAHALLAAATAMYDFNNLPQAERYALEASKLLKIPDHLKGTILVDLALATGDANLIQKALRLAARENDYPALKLTSDFCYIREAFILVDTGKYPEALNLLDTIEEQVPVNLMRRRCYIQMLQAQCFAATGEYEYAADVAQTALTLAQNIQSKPSVARLRRVINTLKKRTGQ